MKDTVSTLTGEIGDNHFNRLLDGNTAISEIVIKTVGNATLHTLDAAKFTETPPGVWTYNGANLTIAHNIDTLKFVVKPASPDAKPQKLSVNAGDIFPIANDAADPRVSPWTALRTWPIISTATLTTGENAISIILQNGTNTATYTFPKSNTEGSGGEIVRDPSSQGGLGVTWGGGGASGFETQIATPTVAGTTWTVTGPDTVNGETVTAYTWTLNGVAMTTTPGVKNAANYAGIEATFDYSSYGGSGGAGSGVWANISLVVTTIDSLGIAHTYTGTLPPFEM